MSPDPLDTAMAFDPSFDAVAFNARYGPPTTTPVSIGNLYNAHTQRDRPSVPISTWVLLAFMIRALAM
ncbi:hypothetical protein ACVH9Z_34330 [Rhodococcus opacus]|uniref:hypothetical protein n=1 Tax=Rhodococcus opacus TaxID=37919 RepID=UPI001B30CB9F|nr:hypothetical protein [Rhodococcus opacus]